MQDLRQYFSIFGRDAITQRTGMSLSSIREAERTNKAAARYYWPFKEWAEEIGAPEPDPDHFSFKELAPADGGRSTP